ncbi:hypothetical protein [Glaciihabitans sp. UYNi722]|uniref:hypothetical protein n=1 Tax=Glaciihabitans sp. UYNi722 TaxID=3156344 RepID=UPI003396795F
MKRKFRVRRPRVLTVLALGAILLALAACAPTGTQSERVTSTNKPVYPLVKTYPSIRVSDNVTYELLMLSDELSVCMEKSL